jgi:membrane protein DedA with SNARE-associated domain
MVFAGELGIPTGVPVEVALLLAGSQLIDSPQELLAGVVLVSVADLLGATTLHLVARTGGVSLLARFAPHARTDKSGFLARWRDRIGGRDVALVFFGRLVPLVRMYVSAGTGLLRIPFRDFQLGAAPAAALWSGVPVVVGYLFRHDVDRFAARYTQLSHLLLDAVPAILLVGGLVWWVRRARSPRTRVRRGRSALGLAAALATVAYLVETAWATQQASKEGVVSLPYPILLLWMALLGLFALALLGVALADLRAAFRTREEHAPFSRVVLGELATTLVWVGLLVVVGAIVTVIELRYPELFRGFFAGRG